jgi:hypothetical protein
MGSGGVASRSSWAKIPALARSQMIFAMLNAYGSDQEATRPRCRDNARRSLARSALGIEVLALTEKFDGDLRWRFLDSFLNLFGGVGQSIRVDIYSDATTRTGHMVLRF